MVDQKLKQLLSCILATQDEEIEPVIWDLQSSELAERMANGEDILTALPNIQQYLNNSPDCCEEFMALVAMLRSENVESDQPQEQA